jgi:tripartite-type tricarboxylate transporter receptor subunit TctC
MRHQFAVMLVVIAAALSAAGLCNAQVYPAKPVRIIVPFAPGGPNDAIARVVGQKLTELWGQTFLVENRGGAGGTIGVEAGLKAAADGYTLIMGGSSTLAVAPGLYAKLPYDPLRDVAPVSNCAFVPYVVTINPRVPAKNMKELVAIAKTKPGYLSYGSSGAGSMSSLGVELINATMGTQIVHVPYRGTAPAVTDMIAGQIDMMVADLSSVSAHTTSGKLRMIAAAGSKRTRAAPALPTVAESGYPGYAVDAWFGLVAPVKTPPEVVAKLSAAVANLMKAPDVRSRLEQYGYDPIGNSASEFGATLRADIEKFARLIKAAGIKADI